MIYLNFSQFIYLKSKWYLGMERVNVANKNYMYSYINK